MVVVSVMLTGVHNFQFLYLKKNPVFMAQVSSTDASTSLASICYSLAMDDTGVSTESVLLAGVHGTMTLQDERRASQSLLSATVGQVLGPSN